VSPVVPHDYATSSLPAAVFVWTVENVSDEPQDVSMMFSFQNGDGGPGDSSGGHRNSAFTTAPESNQAATAGAGGAAAAAEEKKEGAPAEEEKVVGVALAHMHRQRRVFNPKVFLLFFFTLSFLRPQRMHMLKMNLNGISKHPVLVHLLVIIVSHFFLSHLK